MPGEGRAGVFVPSAGIPGDLDPIVARAGGDCQGLVRPRGDRPSGTDPGVGPAGWARTPLVKKITKSLDPI